jgi:phenylacetate-CoA ligase
MDKLEMIKSKVYILVKHKWFNLFRNIRNRMHSHLNEINLLKSQYWTIANLKDFQNKRLRKIIEYAYNNIPGYKRKFDEVGIKPSDIKTKEDLHKLPIITREELQNNDNFVNKKLIYTTLFTGGSTGRSLKYYDSMESAVMRMEAHHRGWLWNGYKIGKRIAIIASSQGSIYEKNVLHLIGDLTEKNLKNNVKKLKEFKPQYLRGYTGSIYILAKYCLDNNIKIEGIKSINPISENLYDFQREIIEKAFDCRIFEEYCCNDGGACAWECEKHNGLHYAMERAIIENINGEMIVTDLWNRAMPFIRYRNGDGIKFLNKKCKCGRNLPLIKVRGRANDIIISKRGPIGATFLMFHGIGYDQKSDFRSGIRAVQYIQKPGYLLRVNIVKNNWCTKETIQKFKRKLVEITHHMRLQINFVDDIPKTKKGKRKFIINEDKELLRKWRFIK